MSSSEPVPRTAPQRRGVYPGSFNPPTTAHLALSHAARMQRSLDQVIWSVSTKALAKETISRPLFEHRLAVLREVAADHSWLEVQVTDAQLLADIGSGFDVLIMGADKWDQIQDLRWYGSESARSAAFERLPELAIAPRPPVPVPDQHLLEVDERHWSVSSTAARQGAHHLMLQPALAFAEQSGAWIAPDRYETFIQSTGSGPTMPAR